MAALPYMQLYIADYLADTFHLTTEEHGAYLLILFNYWQTGRPVRNDRLASVARMSNDRWSSVENTLSEFFNIGDDGVWIHDRIEQDLLKVYAKSTQASRAGKVSANKRASSKCVELVDNSNGRSTDVQRTHQRNGNHTDKDKDKDTDKEKKKNTRSRAFVVPTVDELRDYCLQRKNSINPESFLAYYNSNGWMVGRNKMKDWKSAVVTWEQRDNQTQTKPQLVKVKEFPRA